MEKQLGFADLGVCEQLCLACKRLNYLHPTNIQRESLPYSLQGKDIIGLAQTGSGKTLAFAIPIIQALLDKPLPFAGMVLTPNRQLAVQISDHFKAIGSRIGLKTSVIVGGIDLNMQTKSLKNGPHVVIGTPGKVLYHMENTKAFKFQNVKFLVFDQADKLLSMDFQRQINRILDNIPLQRNTYLFSATMTNKVQKLQRASLKNPIKVQSSKNYQTVQQLNQYYILIPSNTRQFYLFHLIKQITFKEAIVFVNTCLCAIRICLLLRKLGFKACTINGKISQTNRLGAIAKFRNREDNILVATDVASRGLDIPSVDLVINYDLPMNPKDYVHRVGRTARAGRSGKSISFISQYNAQTFLKIQQLIEKKMELYVTNQELVLSFQQHVQQANRRAIEQLKIKLQQKEVEGSGQSTNKGRIRKTIKKKKQVRNKFKKKLIHL